MIDAVGPTQQAIEVLSHDLARQENRAHSKASTLNLSRNVMLISFVLPGLADVSDWHLVDMATRSGGGILGDEDFRADCIWCWNRKRDFVSDSDGLRKKSRQQKLGLIGEHTGSRIVLPLDADHALPADRDGRIEGRKSHAVGGHYRGALQRCKMAIRTQCWPSCQVRKSFPAPVKLTGFQLQSASQASCFQSTSCGISLALCTSSTNQARYALSEDSCPKGGASCSGLGSGGCHSLLAPRLHMAPKNICQQAAQY